MATQLPEQHAAKGLAGGRVYDGCIAACARKGKADEVLTWNARHFETLPAIRVVVPGQAAD